MVERIRAIKPHTLDSIEPDKCIWEGTNLGNLTISSVFYLIAGTNTQVHMEHWSLIWKLFVPERIRSFIWMIHHNEIKTNK